MVLAMALADLSISHRCGGDCLFKYILVVITLNCNRVDKKRLHLVERVVDRWVGQNMRLVCYEVVSSVYLLDLATVPTHM